ncbi:S41 family peptidase [Hymenobacter yonginensis]|uniref:S41 family peptidase n=1 Tax=Hymenobacter yonginensis TaxID=748197 RepID=A0ABY7PV10_9BACT|nr:S41 family peptidase [Hymenobacter yonginensis]WBO86747.1 S41 family peptidase [Hymenobacter yonginensis]
MKRLRYFGILLFVGACCRADGAEHLPPYPAVRSYLEEVAQVLQANFLNRAAVDWVAFRQQLLTKAAGANTPEQAWPAVTAAIQALGDKHTQFYCARPTEGAAPLAAWQPPLFPDESVPEDIGYLRIPWVVGSPPQLAAYITQLQGHLRERDTPGLKGWIVDLRGNMGGNMWPMLVAAGPLLGEDTLGYSIDASNTRTAWRYEKGKALANGDIEAQTASYYTLKTTNPVVAVLTDSLTASSGEAMTVAFKGRKHTRSFGASTCGVSTGRSRFSLSDGSVLLLTTAVFADRRLVRYGHAIAPDEPLRPAETVPRAIRWIREEFTAKTQAGRPQNR